MDTKRIILIVSFLHLIQEKRLKGRWKGAFMKNIFFDEARVGLKNGFSGEKVRSVRNFEENPRTQLRLYMSYY